jgi:outer membrane immunogenic protein
MKRILIAAALALAAGGSALAADIPMPGPPPAYIPAVPFYNWTGFYIGVNGGGAFGKRPDSAEESNSERAGSLHEL